MNIAGYWVVDRIDAMNRMYEADQRLLTTGVEDAWEHLFYLYNSSLWLVNLRAPDTSEPSQLEVLALNYLRNQEVSTIPETQSLQSLPKSNPKISISIVCCVGLRTPFPPPMS
ncbi:hypothetical protein RhiirC2_858317 [Rhizophagus irregularis]|uniref:Uncharacterized protein n=1 Tax=Rhizophagus irregularis TaxID=588596 RepID=A0A2N1M6C8_9GLOM|nr:hypothetical protein RhiirC2_858317 [Rhizophagus irregularis]